MRRGLIIAVAAGTIAAATAVTPAYAGHGTNVVTDNMNNGKGNGNKDSTSTTTTTTTNNNGNGNGNGGANGGGSDNGGNSAPTLHGFCSLNAPCVDSGSNTPTKMNAPTFGFATSGQPATDDVLIDILVPNSVLANPSALSYAITGPLLGTNSETASLVSTSAWTSGQLDSYLALTGGASPTNPIGAYLSATQTYQPGASGFYIYQANIGTVTLPGNSTIGTAAQDNYLMQLDQGLPQGSYILAFIDPPATYGATANSGAILVTGAPPVPAVPEPATWAMMLWGFGGMGVAMRRKGRRDNALMQVA